jgi:hypothetical protein
LPLSIAFPSENLSHILRKNAVIRTVIHRKANRLVQTKATGLEKKAWQELQDWQEFQ